MPIVNEFLTFAIGGGANVESQADYAVDPAQDLGQQPGIASSALNNKALRQACYIASQVAQFLVNQTGTSLYDDGTPANIQAVMNTVWPTPTGTILAFGGSFAPVGYLLCDGSAVSRTTYAPLFSIIGTTFGVGDGSTTFNLPNTKGVFLRGAGTQTISGIPTPTIVAGTTYGDEFQGHYHYTGGTSAYEVSSFSGVYLSPGAGTSANQFQAAVLVAQEAITDGTNGTPRLGTETRPANIGVNYIIKT